MLRSGTIAARNCGSVAEWLKAAVLKTADGKLSVSSNLTASAIHIDAKAPIFGALEFLHAADSANGISCRFRNSKDSFRNYRPTGRVDDLANAAIYGLRDALVGVSKQPRRAPKIVDFAGRLGPDAPELEHANCGRQPFVVSLLCLRNRLAPSLVETVAKSLRGRPRC